MQLLDEENQQWYCYKDDQVWLGKEQKWKEPPVEQPQTEQTQAVKYCKKCGNKLEFGDEFCDKCGAEQKKSVAIAVTGAATEETTSKDRRQKTNPRLLIAAAFIVVILVAAVIWYISIPQPAFFDIRVQSNTSWQGSYGSTGSMTTVDGSGEEDFSAQGTIVSAVFQMQTGNYGDTLTVTIFRSNTVLATQTTTAAYGVVSVSATSTEQGQAQAIQTMQNTITQQIIMKAYNFQDDGCCAELTVTLENVGTTSVNLAGAQYLVDDAMIIGTGPFSCASPSVVTPSQSCQVTVTIAASSTTNLIVGEAYPFKVVTSTGVFSYSIVYGGSS
jgi:hypothetical protein